MPRKEMFIAGVPTPYQPHSAETRAKMREAHGRRRVRLYRLLNMKSDKYGAPFAQCDFHRKNYTVNDCVLEKIADKPVWGCALCEPGGQR